MKTTISFKDLLEKYTPADVARILGVSVQMVYGWKRGAMPIRQIEKIRRRFPDYNVTF